MTPIKTPKTPPAPAKPAGRLYIFPKPEAARLAALEAATGLTRSALVTMALILFYRRIIKGALVEISETLIAAPGAGVSVRVNLSQPALRALEFLESRFRLSAPTQTRLVISAVRALAAALEVEA